MLAAAEVDCHGDHFFFQIIQGVLYFKPTNVPGPEGWWPSAGTPGQPSAGDAMAAPYAWPVLSADMPCALASFCCSMGVCSAFRSAVWDSQSQQTAACNACIYAGTDHCMHH